MNDQQHSGILKAPWTATQVKGLQNLQVGRSYGHPYTCPNRGDGKHHHNGNDLGCLQPGLDGWSCPDCSYTQDWAHEKSAALPSMEDFAKSLFGGGLQLGMKRP